MPAAVAAGPAIRELGKVTLSSSSGQISDISVTPAGDIYVLDANSLVITHFSATGALQNQFPISGVPESSQGHLYFHPEITVDQNRNVYIAATWRPAPRQTSTALFVFDSNGHYARTIPLIPRIEVRHLAIDKDGNFYALGVDPDFFKWKANLCLLVHKYGPDGKRLTAFSACPPNLILRQPNSAVPGPGFDTLNKETSLGKVSVIGGVVYNELAVSHRVRAFDLSGKQLLDTVLEPAAAGVTNSPDPTASSLDILRRVLPLPNNRFLSEWVHTEKSGGARQNARSIAIHDSSGRKLTTATIPDPGTAIVLADETGLCYMLRKKDVTGHAFDLVRVSIDVN